MRRVVLAVMLLAISVAAPTAQDALTTNQRDTDLVQLASMFAKNYAPYEWKRDVIGFDLYRLTPWLKRVHHADDLEFQEALIEYVASLNDAHSAISFRSNFSASLPFTVDIYDGIVRIDSVNRALLPAAQYPFDVGDELLALDGQPVQTLIASLGKYSIFGNPRATARGAAGVITRRVQQIVPHAPELAETAVASIRLASAGAVTSYVIPWLKSGIGIESQGPLPSPRRGNGRIFSPPTPAPPPDAVEGESGPSLAAIADLPIADNTLPSYLEPIRPLLNVSVPKSQYAILGFGTRTPVYRLPAGFVVRLGTQSSHFFFSGTYVSNGVRIGLLRIPNEAPPSTAVALQQLNQEVAFFNSNTDVLVVDITRNTGGSLTTAEAFAQRLIPNTFRTVGFEFRATALEVFLFAQRLTLARSSGAPADIIQNLQNNFAEVLSAYNEERGLTAPIPINALGSFELPPAAVAYTKPLLVLVDELTTSSGDMLAAIFQDNHRGPLLGMRTNGAGGNNIQFNSSVR